MINKKSQDNISNELINKKLQDEIKASNKLINKKLEDLNKFNETINKKIQDEIKASNKLTNKKLEDMNKFNEIINKNLQNGINEKLKDINVNELINKLQDDFQKLIHEKIDDKINYCNKEINELKISIDVYNKKLQDNIHLYNEMINNTN